MTPSKDEAIIYRFENEFHLGPYWELDKLSPELKDLLEPHNWDVHGHPTPANDEPEPGCTLPDTPQGLICGFWKKPQVYHWFTRAMIGYMERDGFHAYQMLVPKKDVCFLHHQCVFHRDTVLWRKRIAL